MAAAEVGPKKIPLFLGGSAPVKRLMTSQDGMALKPGELKVGENIRLTNGLIELRAGQTAITNVAAPTGSGTLKGAYLVERPGTASASSFAELYMALEVSGLVRIYWNQYSGSLVANGGTWGGWQEATNTAGTGATQKYGLTRLAGGADFGWFASFPRNDSYDVFWQSGISGPVLVPATLPGLACEIKAVAAPTWASSVQPTFGPSATLSLTNTGNTNVTYTAVTNTGPTWPAVGANTWDVAMTAVGTAGDQLKIYQTATSISCAHASQLWVVMGLSDFTLLNSCKVYTVTSAGTVSTNPINDPSTSDQKVIVPTNLTNASGQALYLVAFPIDTTSPPTNVAGLAFTVTTNGAGNLTNPKTFSVYSIMAGGGVPGFAQYAVSYYSAGTRTESAGIVMRTGSSLNPTYKVSFSTLLPTPGFTSAGASAEPLRSSNGVYLISPGKFILPLDSSLLYQTVVPLTSVVASATAPTDYINVYRKDPDSDNYFSLASIESAEWTNGGAGPYAWTNYASGGVSFPSMGGTANFTDYVGSDSLDYSKWVPDADNEQMPKGQAMCSTNRRLYVGTKATSSVSGGSVVASELDNPYRYRRVVRTIQNALDESSGFETRLGIGEDVVAVVPAPSAPILGGSNVLAFTANCIYSLYGFNARQIATVGTRSPQSVCSRAGAVYFVDSERVQRRILVRAEQMSRDSVQDQFEAVKDTQVGKIMSVVSRDRLFTVLPTSQLFSANTSHVLVHYQLIDAYESVDTFKTTSTAAPQPAYLIAHPTGNQIISITSDGTCYAYETGSADVAQAITLRAQFQTIKTGQEEKVTVRECTLQCTNQSGTVATVTRTGKFDGATSASTFTFAGGTTNTWKTDVPQAKAVTDAAVDVLLSVPATYPFQVFEWAVTVAPTGSRGPVGIDS